jgi:hypothetical protein
MYRPNFPKILLYRMVRMRLRYRQMYFPFSFIPSCRNKTFKLTKVFITMVAPMIINDDVYE